MYLVFPLLLVLVESLERAILGELNGVRESPFPLSESVGMKSPSLFHEPQEDLLEGLDLILLDFSSLQASHFELFSKLPRIQTQFFSPLEL